MQKHIKNYLKSTNKLPHEIYCELCGSNQSINIHHIISRRYKGTDEINNLIALCQEKCHRWIHDNNTPENRQLLQEIVEKRLFKGKQ